MHMYGNGLLGLEIFEQNALALEQLVRPAGNVLRCPQLITRGKFNGKPAQVETNLLYNTGAYIGEDLEEKLRELTMGKRFSFYLSLLMTLWLQDRRGVVTYDVKPSNLGTYGEVEVAEQLQPDRYSVTLLDFGASWVEGSPYNVVERQEAHYRCCQEIIDTISGIEASAVEHWQMENKMVAGRPIDDFEASKIRYAMSQEHDYQKKHDGKLGVLQGWRDMEMTIEELLERYRSLYFENKGKYLVF